MDQCQPFCPHEHAFGHPVNVTSMTLRRNTYLICQSHPNRCRVPSVNEALLTPALPNTRTRRCPPTFPVPSPRNSTIRHIPSPLTTMYKPTPEVVLPHPYHPVPFPARNPVIKRTTSINPFLLCFLTIVESLSAPLNWIDSCTKIEVDNRWTSPTSA